MLGGALRRISRRKAGLALAASPPKPSGSLAASLWLLATFSSPNLPDLHHSGDTPVPPAFSTTDLPLPRLNAARLSGNHGTSSEAARSILENGFIAGNASTLRLGPGVYFFTDDQPERVLTGAQMARDYAQICGHWPACVLCAKLDFNQLLDLEEVSNQHVFWAWRTAVGRALGKMAEPDQQAFMAGMGLAGRDWYLYLEPITVTLMLEKLPETQGVHMCIDMLPDAPRPLVICVKPAATSQVA
jgi:hypothetical protein